MTDTTQEDVRLVTQGLDGCATCDGTGGCPSAKGADYLCNEAWSRITTLLTAYQNLGSLAFLAALVEEHEAMSEWMGNEWDADEDFDTYLERDNGMKVARNAAHDNAERLREEGL